MFRKWSFHIRLAISSSDMQLSVNNQESYPSLDRGAEEEHVLTVEKLQRLLLDTSRVKLRNNSSDIFPKTNALTEYPLAPSSLQTSRNVFDCCTCLIYVFDCCTCLIYTLFRTGRGELLTITNNIQIAINHWDCERLFYRVDWLLSCSISRVSSS